MEKINDFRVLSMCYFRRLNNYRALQPICPVNFSVAANHITHNKIHAQPVRPTGCTSPHAPSKIIIRIITRLTIIITWLTIISE